MPFAGRARVLERLKTDARNSSHFVWLLADLKYFECANGWIFAFRRVGDVTLIALEPLVPTESHDGKYDAEALVEAWAEFSHAAHVKIAAFVAVYEPFAAVLRKAGFTCVKVGQEPWVDLKECIPTGNAGKGVRHARNHALGQGLTVEEWPCADIRQDHAKSRVLRDIYEEWRSKRLIELSGFLNAVDPFAHMEERRYFVLRSLERIEAFLVATPVPGRSGYFLEDLVSRVGAPRGAGELLTLEAMVRLGEDPGAREASLGVVSLTSIDPTSAGRLPPLIRFLMIQAPAAMSTVYNFNGMEIYRKRFKPRVWESVFLGVAPPPEKPGVKPISPTLVWLKVIWSLLVAFRPRFRPTVRWLRATAAVPLRKAPFTCGFMFVSFALFAKVNHFGALPDWALAKYGFFANASLHEWVVRTVASDFLYFDPGHFASSGIPLFALMYWAERTHKRKFFFTLMIGSLLFDDVINYWVLVRPFATFRPSMFHHLVAYKDVGGSLILATLVGMQLCQFRLIREPLVALITLAFVLGFAFTSARLEWLIMNLDHAIFFVFGFLLGKADFEYKRHLSRRASRKKPPTGRSVLAPQRHHKAKDQ